jgi:hypothetical protein
MRDVNTDIQEIVEAFVAAVSAIAQREAMEALSVAFATVPGAHRGGARRGQKRDPAAIVAIAEKFVAFVAAHPGLRIEQINKEIGTRTKDLALPIRKLIAEGRISVQGSKRSTTYFVKDAPKPKKTAK